MQKTGTSVWEFRATNKDGGKNEDIALPYIIARAKLRAKPVSEKPSVHLFNAMKNTWHYLLYHGEGIIMSALYRKVNIIISF